MKKYRLSMIALFSLIISVSIFADDQSRYEQLEDLFQEAKAPTRMDQYVGGYFGLCFTKLKWWKWNITQDEIIYYYSATNNRYGSTEERSDGKIHNKNYFLVMYDKKSDRIIGRNRFMDFNATHVPERVQRAWNYIVNDNDLKSFLWSFYKIENQHQGDKPFRGYIIEGGYKEGSYYNSGLWRKEAKMRDLIETYIRIDMNGKLITKVISRKEEYYCHGYEKEVSCSDFPKEYQPLKGCD